MKELYGLTIIIILLVSLLIKQSIKFGKDTTPKEIIEYKRLDSITLQAPNDFLKTYRTRLRYNDYGVTIEVYKKEI